MKITDEERKAIEAKIEEMNEICRECREAYKQAEALGTLTNAEIEMQNILEALHDETLFDLNRQLSPN